HKGHRQALEALTKLTREIPNVRWLMVGDGRLRPQLQREADAQGLLANVVFTGAVSDEELDRHLRSADVFCLLSQRPPDGAAGEGFGIVLIEAGARGLPVVAGDVPGVRDAVRRDVSGLLVSPEDPAAAAAALARVLTDPGLALRLGAAGLARARELAWPRVAGSYRRLIDHVLTEDARGRSSGDMRWLGDLARGPVAAR
ncbi:MAG: glycosyltransferase, partial [Trebonia sp.]